MRERIERKNEKYPEKYWVSDWLCDDAWKYVISDVCSIAKILTTLSKHYQRFSIKYLSISVVRNVRITKHTVNQSNNQWLKTALDSTREPEKLNVSGDWAEVFRLLCICLRHTYTYTHTSVAIIVHHCQLPSSHCMLNWFKNPVFNNWRNYSLEMALCRCLCIPLYLFKLAPRMAWWHSLFADERHCRHIHLRGFYSIYPDVWDCVSHVVRWPSQNHTTKTNSSKIPKWNVL